MNPYTLSNRSRESAESVIVAQFLTLFSALPTFRDHIERHCSDVLEEILLHSDHTCHFGVDVHLGDLSESYPNHANKLVREHTRFVPVLEEAVKQAAMFVYESHENREKMYARK